MVRAGVVCSLAGLALSVSAQPGSGLDSSQTLSFSGLPHGTVLAPDAFADQGVTISAFSSRLGAVPGVVFDTRTTSTADPDLNGPPFAGGNLPVSTDLGGVLILPENLTDRNGDGIVDSPDDEGRRPAGSITFDFLTPIISFGLDVLDIESVVQERTALEFLSGGLVVGRLEFEDLTDPSSRFFDGSLVFGNNTINRIDPVLASDFQAASFDRVTIVVGGSSAFDNIVFEQTVVPAPASVALVGAAGLVLRRRR